MQPAYSINHKILSLVSAISEKLGELKAIHLMRPPVRLRRENRIRTIQATLGVEGNTLTLEQVTSIIEGNHVIGPERDILEVRNSIAVYESLNKYNPFRINSFKKAHADFMNGLVDSPGKFRGKAAGIMRGSELVHLAPPADLVNPLMKDLFDYLNDTTELILIKSCVFHYEMEFIHPFPDGNGRMGRLWQSLVLMQKNPVFEFLPVESVIKTRQDEYYQVLEKCDNSGESTEFIEFMLGILDESLADLLNTQNNSLRMEERIELYRSEARDGYFTRKEYLRYFKRLSTATASRDLKFAADNKIIEKSGEMNKSKYRYT